MRASRVVATAVVAVSLVAASACSPPARGASGTDGAGGVGSTAPAAPSTDPTAASAPASAPAATPPGALTAAEVRVDGVVAGAGDVTIAVRADEGPATAGDGPDGSVLISVPGGGAYVATSTGLVAQVQGDGSAVLAADDGVAVAGLSVRGPAGATGGGAGAAAAASAAGRLVAEAPDLLRVETSGPTDALTLWFTTRAVTGLSWGDREGGRSLAVEPTDWARTNGDAALVLLWQQLVAAEPDADSATMRDQLTCHVLGAPDKATWNLEPWRPDVGLVATLAARCNPT